MKHSVLSTVLLATMLQLVMFLSHGYLLDNGVVSDSVEVGGDYTDIKDIGLTDTRKRAQLSLTGGLRSLAHMVYGQRNSERSAHQNALLLLGKRNWRLPVNNFGARLNSKILRPSLSSSSITRRRSQQLSVSGPLSALANMLAAEGRRRKQSESFNNRMKLLEIGKRNSNINQIELDQIDGDIRNDSHL